MMYGPINIKFTMNVSVCGAPPVRRRDVTLELLVTMSCVVVAVKWNALYSCLTGRT
jgi:hypothetical protein